MVGFIFGGNTGETAESLARKRAMIERLMTGDGTPKTAQEGWARVMSSLGGAIGGYRLDQQQKAGADEARKTFADIAGGLFGQTPASSAASSSSIPTPRMGEQAAATAPVTEVAPGATVASLGSNDIVQGVMDAAKPVNGAPSFLKYANQGATRSMPLNEKLVASLGFLPELGVTAEVFSGGQPAAGQGPRTGSTRHDHGNAADVNFYKDGRKLDWANPEDQPLFQEIVKRGKAAGLTGFGAGPGYMSPGSMHIGFGNPGVWGAGGKGANAPEWLRAAYGEQPASKPMPSYGQAMELAPVAQSSGVAAINAQMAPPLEAPREVASLNVAAQPAQQGNPNSPFIPKDMRAQPQAQVAQAQTNRAPSVDPRLFQILSSPFTPPDIKAQAQMLLQQQMQAQTDDRQLQKWKAQQDYERTTQNQDPLRQLQLEKAKLEIEQAKNGPGDTKVVGNRLVRVGRDGSVTDITPRDTPSGSSFRFSGNSVEAQALNGLMESGQLTEGQAQQLAAGKQVTGPNGEILFLTPQGIFSRPGGSQAQSQQQEIDIFGGASASSTPIQAPATTPAPQQGSAPSPQQGAIQLTGPKAKDTQLPAEMGARIGLGDAFLEMVPNLRERLQRGDASGPIDGFKLFLGKGDPASIWRDIETGRDALVRNLTGAGMSESEAANQTLRYQISPTDTAEVMVQKLNNLERDLLATRRGAIGARTGNMGPEPKPSKSNKPVSIGGYTIEEVN